ITVLILIGHSASLQDYTRKFITSIAGAIKGSISAQIAQLHAYNRTTTPHFNMLPFDQRARLALEFKGYTLFQVTSRNHKNSFSAESPAKQVIIFIRHLQVTEPM